MNRKPPNTLTAARKLAYGAGELGPAMAGSTMIFFQMIFLTNVAGLAPGLAGSVLLVGKIWDAVNDPLIGWLSDRTRTRFGRRVPWMVVCAVPFALFFFLNWWVPDFAGEGSQLGLFLYYTGVSIAFSSFYTGMALPHSSLTPELSSDYDERSRITGFRMAFSLGGSVGGLLVALVVFKVLGAAADTVKYAAMGAVVAVIGVVSMAVCVAGIWRLARRCDRRRREQSIAPRGLPLRERVTILLGNRPFLLVCGIYLFSWMAMQFTATILPYYAGSWLGLPTATFQLVALTVQGTALLLIPVWGWACVRMGKKPVYFLGMAFWLMAQAGLVLLAPGPSMWIYVLAVLAGVGISVCYLVPNAMLPDVIELDELETGQRREGIYYGCFVFLQKIALALGTFFVGQALALAGYISAGPGEVPPVQPESALTAIRLAIGPLPALAIIAGMILAAFYPINKSRHAQILARIDARRRGGPPRNGPGPMADK
jgi:glycoside/pentoside/hexuronide:cation symporter, GPH family